MIIIQTCLLLGAIILAARLGGIGVGLAGGLGMAIAVFGLGLPPGSIPVSVILIIMSVILALSVMQQAGGMNYMVSCAEKMLRNHPKYINILAPGYNLCTDDTGWYGLYRDVGTECDPAGCQGKRCAPEPAAEFGSCSFADRHYCFTNLGGYRGDVCGGRANGRELRHCAERDHAVGLIRGSCGIVCCQPSGL